MPIYLMLSYDPIAIALSFVRSAYGVVILYIRLALRSVFIPCKLPYSHVGNIRRNVILKADRHLSVFISVRIVSAARCG